MPGRAPTVCATGGCPEVAIAGGHCAGHQRKPWRNPSPSSTQLKGARWNRTRRRALARASWVCQVAGCAAKATDVHHLTPIADGGAVFDPANLQAICAEHHRKQHRRSNT